MNPKHRLPLVLTAALALAVGASPLLAAAAPPVPQCHPGPFAPILRCLSIVNLTDAQKADIQAVFEAARPEAEALHAKLMADREALKAEIEKTPPDPCAVGTAALALHVDREAARALFERVKADVLALLTPGQKVKLAGCLEAPRCVAVCRAGAEGDPEE